MGTFAPQSRSYTYDSVNRLIQVSDQSFVTSLYYNGLGQRLGMDAAGVIAHYVMDGDLPPTAETNGNTTSHPPQNVSRWDQYPPALSLP